MFQNISNRQDTVYADEIRDNKEIYTFLKNIFNPKNMIIYIIGFCISVLSIKGKMYPFALSILGASVCTQVPIIGVLVSTSIGIICATDVSIFVKYLITLVIFLVFNIILKPKKTRIDRNEKYKLTYRLIIFNFLIQFIGVGSLGFGDRLLFSAIHSSFVYIGYKICICGIATIQNINNKKIFADIEMVSASLLISIVLFMINKVMFFNINITNLIMIFMLFYVAFKNGYICGGIAGFTIGLFGIIYSKCDILYLINLMLTGICGGLFCEYNKILSLTAMVISNLIFSLILVGNPTYFVNVAGIILLYLMQLFIKDNYQIDELLFNIPLLEEKFETSLEQKPNKQDSNNATMIFETDEELEKHRASRELFIEKFYTAFNKKESNLLYEEINKNKDIMIDTYEAITKGKVIDKECFVEILEKNDYYILSEDRSIKSSINDVIKIINKVNNQAIKKEKNSAEK